MSIGGAPLSREPRSRTFTTEPLLTSPIRPPAQPRAVLVFARAPEPGRVKTRLAATLGDAAALAVYRWLAERTVGEARRVPECRVTVCHAGAAPALAEWLGVDLALRAQCEGDLGARIADAAAHAFAAGARRVAIVGTDCPDLDARRIGAALDALDDADAAFGPADDGGYYLVALARPLPALFRDVPWSAPDTLDATLAVARREGLHVALLPTLQDVDTAADWERWRATLPPAERSALDATLAAASA